uniref:Putative secreted salivary protein n=1 Tax=Ixodes ricinus TaxID=34613 RepID=V5GIQ0_IXORI
MKNTGFSFFIIQTARLIVAMVVLFAICKPIAAGVDIAGVESLAPNCEGRIKALCDHTENGELKKVAVGPRQGAKSLALINLVLVQILFNLVVCLFRNVTMK